MPSICQKEAINHFAGPCEVIAGPGSGKTTVIIQRIHHLISNHKIHPEQILVLTFSKAAALELKNRFSLGSSVTFQTFHSLSYNIIGFHNKKLNHCMISDSDKREYLSVILNNLGIYELEYEDVSEILSRISREKNQVPSKLVISESKISEDQFVGIKKSYNDMLHENKKMDYDDLICDSLKLLQENHALLNLCRTKFQFILVDEFQDINLPQYQLIKLLSAPLNNLFVVGDDDQSIYGFRGSSPQIMKTFLEDYSNSRCIFLTENFRSGAAIVKLAQDIISDNKIRFMKQFKARNIGGEIRFFQLLTHEQEEKMMVECLNKISRTEHNHTAILVRTNGDCILWKDVLMRAGLLECDNLTRCNIYEMDIINDLLAFLKFVYKEKERNLFLKFVNKPNRYISRDACIEPIIQETHLINYYHNNREIVNTIHFLFRMISLAQNVSPNKAISIFRKYLKYDSYIEHKNSFSIHKDEIIKQLDSLQNSIKNINNIDKLTEYIENKKQENNNKGYMPEKTTTGIKIMTMHSSKGLEFDNVFIPDLNEGIIPSKRIITMEEMEQERRVLYVAITRAKKSLYLFCTKERNRELSRFLINKIK